MLRVATLALLFQSPVSCFDVNSLLNSAAKTESLPVTCQDEKIPSLEGGFPKARICCPQASNGERFPITIYQHGDGGGGLALSKLYSMFNKMAAEGVCVVAPYSCSLDSYCQNGEVSYQEVLKALVYLEQNKKAMEAKYPLDFS
jgi:poly(3-hydroxybutyrate) depolymerase